MNTERTAQPRPFEAGDSDINCNGGAPIGTMGNGDKDACSGLDIFRKKDYTNDTNTRLTITGGTLRKIRFIGNQSIDLFQKNWLLYIHPHSVMIHTFDAGATVQIDALMGNFQQQPDSNHRKHSDVGAIEKMELFVENQPPQPLPSCKFTIVYD